MFLKTFLLFSTSYKETFDPPHFPYTPISAAT